MKWYWFSFGNGFTVTMNLIKQHTFKWDRVRGVQIGRWFIGAIRGHKISEEPR